MVTNFDVRSMSRDLGKRLKSLSGDYFKKESWFRDRDYVKLSLGYAYT